MILVVIFFVQNLTKIKFDIFLLLVIYLFKKCFKKIKFFYIIIFIALQNFGKYVEIVYVINILSIFAVKQKNKTLKFMLANFVVHYGLHIILFCISI